jgi:hypothetical protein
MILRKFVGDNFRHYYRLFLEISAVIINENLRYEGINP